MKLLKDQRFWVWLSCAVFAVFAMLAPEVAFAKADIKGITGDSVFKDVITLAFALLAFVKWIDFFSEFSPGSALKALVLPAIITFLAFKWTMVLGWFKLV